MSTLITLELKVLPFESLIYGFEEIVDDAYKALDHKDPEHYKRRNSQVEDGG